MKPKINIAITDDETLFRQGVAFILSRHDHIDITFQANDGQELLGKLVTQDILPDIILLDLKMPFLSGFDFMKSIRGRKDDLPLPVLILTVISYQEAISRSFELGAADYITKPFMEMEVVTRIINLLRIFYYRKKIARNNEFLEEKVKERTTDLSKA